MGDRTCACSHRARRSTGASAWTRRTTRRRGAGCGSWVRRRDFGDSHAERWTCDDWHRGVQADDMTLRMDGKESKSFRAVCPRTRRQVYSRATSAVARSFLREVVEKLSPERVQVDGGSEFMGAFEDECEALALPLKVLPPRSPELNGMVERANRSERIECWSQHRGVGEPRHQLAAWIASVVRPELKRAACALPRRSSPRPCRCLRRPRSARSRRRRPSHPQAAWRP